MVVMNAGVDSKDIWKEFGPWLRRQREIAGKSRKEVAAAIKIHIVQLARIETGESGTRKDTLDALINYLNLDPKEAYRMAGFWWPNGKDEESEPPEDDRALLASQSAEAMKILIELPPDERAKLLAIMRAASGRDNREIKIMTPEEWLKKREGQGPDVEQID
jgi:transcriptional regulator with XRE-family HTH domain